ncbi:MAG TPA: hypothetical protein PK079_21665 [Leptospiraceae bacterium]|nr:hypothetical protein [Leptospiraceae bacterium]HMW08095.1 hypothetical protein [Leptospiraceae bacterium]HMX34858.1 hypothetical protein [Leptospiraceae bacterium]HMY33806.1 hypothetical protein [Leptospiraceae bacterium]HMZ65917.1 hypothetical protein [Leptospiraceae bacterium]
MKIVFGEPISFDEEYCQKILIENSSDSSNSRESVQFITDWTFAVLKKLEQSYIKD